MICCLLAALLLGPLGLWAIPRARVEGGEDCCRGGRRKRTVIAAAAIGVAALCLAGFLLSQSGAASFRHICSAWVRP